MGTGKRTLFLGRWEPATGFSAASVIDSKVEHELWNAPPAIDRATDRRDGAVHRDVVRFRRRILL
jgi:hypothetical protein